MQRIVEEFADAHSYKVTADRATWVLSR